MNLIIKPMESEAEIDGKAFVHYKSWHETYEGLVDGAYMEGVTLEKCREAAHRRPENIIIAKTGSRTVGFVGYGAYRDETLPGCGEVFALYVLGEYHGRRVGYALMNAALARLSDYEKIAVWVLKGNDRAARFYERYGFRFDGAESEIVLGSPNTELRMIYERRGGRAEA